MSQGQIKIKDLEFFYLVELTRQKIKPLSRWEKPLNETALQWLRSQGFYVEVIPRKTLLRKQVFETIFSTTSHYIDFYSNKFNNTHLRKDPLAQKSEGFLFGYPSCCVRQFIKQPYIQNNIKKEDQSILFHWACPDCRATYELLPYYNSIHRRTLERYDEEIRPLVSSPERSLRKFHKKAAIAAGIVLALSTGNLLSQTFPDTTHFIPISNDSDVDGLAYAEEFYLGTDYINPFTQEEGKNDGEFWSAFFKTLIDNLPTEEQAEQPYKIECHMDGIETCKKCGKEVDMGHIIIVNPLRNMELDIPYIGLHYMENGCFSYWGDIHEARVNMDALKKILFAYDPKHILSVKEDSDNDGLTDAEEDSLYLNPNDPDTDKDGLPDGADVAEQLIRLFPKLKEKADNAHSSVSFYPVFGIENCTICGSIHNMGYVEFTNPENGRTYKFHFNGLHALAHGSFAYDGTTNSDQRADAVKLYRTMKTHVLFIDGDSDNDGLTNEEELYFGYDPEKVDTNGDGVCDGMDLALSLTGIMDSLPTEPVQDGPYILHNYTRGVWNCLLCGDPINMGFMEIFNPKLSSDSLQVSYYAYHFLKKGSFAYEGRTGIEQWLEGRTDPIELAKYLDYLTGISSESPIISPDNFVLEQNYPNPFNPVTTIRFELPRSLHIELSIFDSGGKRIKTLFNCFKGAGSHSIQWDGTNESGVAVASGLYIYKLQSANFVLSKKMLLLR